MRDHYIDINKSKKQKIYIDVSIMKQLLFLTGIQRVVKEIILQLYKYDDIELEFLDYDDKRRAFIRVPQNKFMNFLRKGNYPKKRQEGPKYIAPEQIEEGAVFFELDATWMCKMKRSYLYPILKEHGVKIIVHIYDIICVTHPQFFDDLLVYKFLDYVGAAMQYADTIICNANATKQDLLEVSSEISIIMDQSPENTDTNIKDASKETQGPKNRLINPSNIKVVPLGANFTERAVNEEAISPEIRKAVSGNKYILMVGTIEPRKNHKLLLDAYDAGLKDLGYNIILAGTPGWKNDDFMNRLTNHPDYGKRIFLLTRQPDYVIDYLYKNARFIAFLSYKEGFGLPIIESLAKGVPVIASDTPINKEIGTDKCIYFKQDDPEALCKQIELIDEKRYNEIRNTLKGFTYCTWETSGKLMKDAIT